MRYPFSFALPNGLPPTFAQYCGGIAYTLKGHCGMKAMLKIDPRVQIHIPIVGSLNAMQVQLHSVPRHAKNEKSFLFNKGKCSATVQMNSSASYVGHTLSGTVVVQNGSNKTLTRIKAKVVQVATFRAQGHYRVARAKGPKIVLSEDKVPAGGTFEASFQIAVPNTGEFVPSVRSGTNNILTVEHFVIVVCDASFARDLEVLVPIHLSPTPAQLEPAPMPLTAPVAPIFIDNTTLQMAQEATGAVVVQQATVPIMAGPMHASPHPPQGAPPPGFGVQQPVQQQQQAYVKQPFYVPDQPYNKK